MATAVPTTQKAVLEAFRDRLIAEIPALTASTCVIAMDPDPHESQRTYLMAIVEVGDGQFGPEQDGGGGHVLFEYGSVDVTLYSRMKLDAHGKAEAVLLDAQDGLLVVKQQVLKALLYDWMPLDEDGNFLLINFPQGLHSRRPEPGRRQGDRAGVLTLSFSTDFHWDLT